MGSKMPPVKDRNPDCEKARIYELFEDLGDRPIVFIRFNPDSYLNLNKIRIPGCFKLETQYKKDGSEKCVTLRKINEELEKRCETISDRIKYHLNNIPKEMLTVEYLFYDNYQ